MDNAAGSNCPCEFFCSCIWEQKDTSREDPSMPRALLPDSLPAGPGIEQGDLKKSISERHGSVFLVCIKKLIRAGTGLLREI